MFNNGVAPDMTKSMQLKASVFRSGHLTVEDRTVEAAVTGLSIDVAEVSFPDFARACVWIEPGDPERSNRVEAPVHLWNAGLDPKIRVPAQSEVVVEVYGASPQEVRIQWR